MSDEEALEPEDSPCVLVCSMDWDSGFCFGCGRSRDEIAYWTVKTKEERAEILKQLPARVEPLREKLAAQRSKRRVNKRGRRRPLDTVDNLSLDTPETAETPNKTADTKPDTNS